MNEQEIREIVQQVLTRSGPPLLDNTIPVEASARHVHLTAQAVEALFGPGATLEPVRELSQPGEFLSDRRVRILTPKGELSGVAVLGPVRSAIQAELSLTDARVLGIQVPVNLSGDLTGAADVYLMGTAGLLEAKGCAIAARAHIHMTQGDALRLGVRHGQAVKVRVHSRRPVVFEQVPVRVSDKFALAMHIDFDEANACCLEPGCRGEIIL